MVSRKFADPEKFSFWFRWSPDGKNATFCRNEVDDYRQFVRGLHAELSGDEPSELEQSHRLRAIMKRTTLGGYDTLAG